MPLSRGVQLPLHYKIDPDCRLVRARAWGVLTNDDLRDYYPRLIADARFHPDYRQLTSLDEVTAFTVDTCVLAEAAGWSIYDVGTRRAIVAREDVAFGLARMFSVYAERVGQNVRAFRDAAVALEWIDSPSDPVRESRTLPAALQLDHLVA